MLSLGGILTDEMRRLKLLDIEAMRQLHDKVNLIPVIAKADTLTEEEVVGFKARVCFIVASPAL
jgi:septin 7